MNEAEGRLEGFEGAASEREEVDGSQDLDFNSVRMRRRIISSGTREPEAMCDSASRPRLSCQLGSPINPLACWDNKPGTLTQFGFAANGIAQEISRTDCGELWEPLHKALCLGSLANTWRSNEDNASCSLDIAGCHYERLSLIGKICEPGGGSCS